MDFRVILRSEVGSVVHGISDETCDRDEIGICIESPELFFDVNRKFEQYVYRSAEERDGKSAPSLPGDLDLTIYSLQKWVKMAIKGNPSALLILFSPKVIQEDRFGSELKANNGWFWSKKVGYHTLGYMRDQRERMMGIRGQKNVKRASLVEKFGYDTKYATHLIRLGVQGVEFLRNGKVTLPMPDFGGAVCRNIRAGGYSIESVILLSSELEREIYELLSSKNIPDYPDIKSIQKFMIDCYIYDWQQEKL